MTITTYTQVSDLIDRKALDPLGDKIGTISNVYVDEETDEPAWLAITTGWFGTRVSFAPVAGAYMADDDVVVAYPKDTVKDAPNIEGGGNTLPPDEAFSLYAYYAIGTKPASGRAADLDSTVTTRPHESGRVRLRKWVETDDVNMTVPIRREDARMVSGDAALSGPDMSVIEHEDRSTRTRNGAIEDTGSDS